MFTHLENRYLDIISEEIARSETLQEAKEPILTWLNRVRDGHETHERIEEYAKEILTTYPQLKNNSKRYRFKVNCCRTQLIKIIFDNVFKPVTANKIIKAAEGASVDKSFYPIWKNVLYIQLSRIAGSVIGNRVVQVALSIAVLSGTVIAVTQLYNTVTCFTARVLMPRLINHTPLQVIQLFNSSMHAMDWVRLQVFKILFYSSIAKWVVQWLKIPYVGPTIERINNKVWDFFLLFGKSTLNGECIEKGFKAIFFTWNICNTLSNQLKTISVNAEHQRDILLHEKAFAVWSNMMKRERLPL